MRPSSDGANIICFWMILSFVKIKHKVPALMQKDPQHSHKLQTVVCQLLETARQLLSKKVFKEKKSTSSLQIKGPEAATGAAIGHKTDSRPAVNSCQCRLSEGEQFGVDDGEHGLTAAVAVSQGEL